MAEQTISRELAKFIVNLDFSALPQAVQEKARVCLLNGYGIAMGCYNTPYAPVARKAALAMEGERADGGATLLGDGRKTGISGALLANCALFHGRAQEDTCGAAHLGTIMIPLLTALAESRKLPAARLLPALVAGYEIGGLLEGHFGRHTTPSGFRASPLYGSIAAAAAAAKMIGLSEPQTTAALANAASFTGGVLQSFADGTDEWRYQVGVASHLGHVSAQLAVAGSVSAPHAFEGKAGMLTAFSKAAVDAPHLLSKLGKEWSIHRVTFKPYPVCAFNQTPVNAALGVRSKLEGRPLKAVRVYMNPFETGYAGMDAVGPFHSVSGTLMSIPFCIANTLLYGAPDMKRMTTYDDAAVRGLIERVALLSTADIPILSCKIEVDLEDGSALRHEQRMTTEDYNFDRGGVSQLIRRIGAEGKVPPAAYDRLETFVEALPNADIAEVLACFAALPRT